MYYITDLYEGMVRHTYSKKVAEEFALCEDYFVVDAETSEWIQSDLNRVATEEV